MRILIYDWAFDAKMALARAGYEHNEIVEGDPFQVAKALYEVGLNVMIKHKQSPSEDYDILVAVDASNFGQR
jgi:hypothetical protein